MQIYDFTFTGQMTDPSFGPFTLTGNVEIQTPDGDGVWSQIAFYCDGSFEQQVAGAPLAITVLQGAVVDARGGVAGPQGSFAFSGLDQVIWSHGGTHGVVTFTPVAVAATTFAPLTVPLPVPEVSPWLILAMLLPLLWARWQRSMTRPHSKPSQPDRTTRR